MSVIKSNQSGLGGSGDVGGALGSFYSHTLDQSLRFNDNDSAYLSRTPASSGNLTTWTWSCWVKRCNLTDGTLFSANYSSNQILFSSDRLYFEHNDGSNNNYKISTDKIRDTSAWYHLVFIWDTSNATAADRMRMYINSRRVTNFDSSSNPSLNVSSKFNTAITHEIGHRINPSNFYLDGYLAEVNFIDGSALEPTNFGETKDGVWVPKEYSGSYGTNGFHLPFSHDTVSEGFTPVLYEGTRAVQSIRGVGFKPDMVFVKRRDGTQEPSITDSVRGVNAQLRPAASNVESSQTNSLTSFDADGFTLGADGTNSYNYYQDSHVAWCWEAGGAPTADNSAGAGATPTAGSVKIDGSNLGSALAGSIAATRLSANTTKGFSIVTYTGNGTAGATVAHGLSSAPEMIMVKSRSQSTSWTVYHSGTASDAETDYLVLDVANAAADLDTAWNDTAPTNSVFSLGTFARVNASTETFVAYSWHSVSGYSKFGSYTGSGSSGKAITGLGFRPVFVMIKRTDSSGGWHVFDSVRFPNNPIDERLEWDNADAENSAATVDIDFDSDGFTLKTSFDNMNASSGEYVYMAFADTRDSVFYKDASGNLNNFEVNNLFTTDVVPDSPTNNFCTLNPLAYSTLGTLSEGNLKIATSTNNRGVHGTVPIPTSGKWYWELHVDSYSSGGGVYVGFGSDASLGYDEYANTKGVFMSTYNQAVDINGSTQSSPYNSQGNNSTSNGDIYSFALDVDNQKFYVAKNGTYRGSSDPSAGSGGLDVSAVFTNAVTELTVCLTRGGSYNETYSLNFGQDSRDVASANADGNGIGTFEYAVPTGFLALCTSNLPDITIGPGKSQQADDNFDTLLYTGTGGTGLEVDGLSFQPDWLWIKRRDSAQNFSNAFVDSVRGNTKNLISNRTDAESTSTGTNDVQSFDSDGFTVGPSNQVSVNDSGGTFVAWCWKAGTSVSGTTTGSGTGQAYTGSVNTDAGFSIIAYTGNGTAGHTIPHHLGVAPKMVISKKRSSTGSWGTYHAGLTSASYYILLNDTAGQASNTVYFNGTAPTDSVVTRGTGADGNANGVTYIQYSFAEIEGYSKIGTYTGNGNADGTFVYTGFSPAFVLLKKSSASGDNWSMYDNKRDPDNVVREYLIPNDPQAAGATDTMDFVSNGFKVRNSGAYINTSGATYIYLAFAEAPFKFANAR